LVAAALGLAVLAPVQTDQTLFSEPLPRLVVVGAHNLMLLRGVLVVLAAAALVVRREVLAQAGKDLTVVVALVVRVRVAAALDKLAATLL
jgi:hypothetical protein